MSGNKQQDKKQLITESKELQLKSYERQLKANINSMLDNFMEMIRQAKVNPPDRYPYNIGIPII